MPDRAAKPSLHEARWLIAESVHSVGALDLLVLLRDSDRWWTVPEIADALHCPAPWAERELRALRAGGLVASNGDGRHALRPRDADIARAMDALATAYATRPREVVRLIFAARR